MHLLGPADVVPALQAPPTAGPLSPPAQPDGVGSTERWTVQPGQCFWTIAETVLARAWGRAPADAEIVPYWQRIISVNRAALAAPSNPDLIFPGQVFEVPHP
jgi:nucleoid-associated protein YgaU